MKCHACGYQYKTKNVIVDKVIRYKSGQKKGQIKEVTTEAIELKIGTVPFHKLVLEKEAFEFELENKRDSFFENRSHIYLYACPECRTIRFEYL